MKEIYDFLFATQLWFWAIGIGIVTAIIAYTMYKFCPRFVCRLMELVFGVD